MKNVTITLEEELARWARIEAARRETSVSRMVGEMLEEKRKRDEGRRADRNRFFSVAPRKLREPGETLPRREELHDRPRLR
jgi:hypothetical protein